MIMVSGNNHAIKLDYIRLLFFCIILSYTIANIKSFHKSRFSIFNDVKSTMDILIKKQY